MGKYKNMHFTGEILESMGRDLCRALLVINQNSSLIANPTQKKPQFKQKKTPAKTETKISLPIMKEFNIDSILKEMLNTQEILHNGEAGNSSSSGSDSEPSEDNLDYEVLKKLMPLSVPTKKKILPPSKKKPVSNKIQYIPKPKFFPRKKCGKCGENELPGHTCKIEAPPPPVRRKPIGLRTYYNISGKRVHDQATQTPPALYPKLFSRRHGSAVGPQTPDSFQDLSNSSYTINEDGFLSDSQSIKFPNFRVHKQESNSNSSGFLDLPKKPPQITNSLK